MKRASMEVGRKQAQVRYQVVEGRLWVHAFGTTWDVSAARSARRVSERQGRGGPEGVSPSKYGHSTEVRSPMPGKILKIMVKVGETVETNQPVIAMEAMKMEYTLRSEAAGLVKEILCREQQQVALDDLLIEIEAKGAL